MRRFVEGLCRLMLRIFFRRVDVVGATQVPVEGPLLIVANHMNGLMDPLVMLVMSPRPVSFMSKEPLFRTPVISVFVKALDCLPVYRKTDGADTTANRRTMEAARALMMRGGALGIFPEGISHDEPQLQPLKTGAARMALATQRLLSDAGHGPPLRIQPVGLYFEDKGTFRSDAVVVWGVPVEVPVVDIDGAAEPARDDVHALTATMAEALRTLTPEADEAGRIALAARVARLLGGVAVEEGAAPTPPGPAERMGLMQRLLAGQTRAETITPARLRAVVDRIEAHERDLSYWGLPPDHDARLGAGGGVLRSLVGTLLRMLLAAPLSLAGLLVNYPAYRLIGILSKRLYAEDNDILSTAKTLGGLVLFPLSWCVTALAAGLLLGPVEALLVLVTAPMCALSALHFAEHLDALGSAARSLRLLLSGRGREQALREERRAIRDELRAIEGELG